MNSMPCLKSQDINDIFLYVIQTFKKYSKIQNLFMIAKILCIIKLRHKNEKGGNTLELSLTILRFFLISNYVLNS